VGSPSKSVIGEPSKSEMLLTAAGDGPGTGPCMRVIADAGNSRRSSTGDGKLNYSIGSEAVVYFAALSCVAFLGGTRSLYRPRSVCKVTSGRQLKRAATTLVPTPREVYPIILPCHHGPDARRRGVWPLVTMAMPHGRQI
jgi:hypothetical protein